jgi:hypothetical protein
MDRVQTNLHLRHGFPRVNMFTAETAENAEKTIENLCELCVSAVKIVNRHLPHRASRDFEKAIAPTCVLKSY